MERSSFFVVTQHCTANQEYVPGACRCECSNIDDRRKCESENQTRYPTSNCYHLVTLIDFLCNINRYWDSRNCMCRCRDNGVNSQCSTGFYFNEDVCKSVTDSQVRVIINLLLVHFGVDRCTPWVFQRRDFDLGADFSLDEEESRHPVVIAQKNDIQVNRRPAPPSRPIYKEEDNYKEEEKKSRPVERFQFVNNWNLQNSRPRQP